MLRAELTGLRPRPLELVRHSSLLQAYERQNWGCLRSNGESGPVGHRAGTASAQFLAPLSSAGLHSLRLHWACTSSARSHLSSLTLWGMSGEWVDSGLPPPTHTLSYCLSNLWAHLLALPPLSLPPQLPFAVPVWVPGRVLFLQTLLGTEYGQESLGLGPE